MDGPGAATQAHVEGYLRAALERGVGARGRARSLSIVRQLHRFLVVDGLAPHDPTELLERPQLSRKLPQVLGTEDLEQLLLSIDETKPRGLRDAAVLAQAGVEPGVEGVSRPPLAGRAEKPKKGRKPGLDGAGLLRRTFALDVFV